MLVRPRNPLNIGAAARAMANFGFRELVVVDPYEPTWQETRSAVGAEDLVTSARALPTLTEAVSDAALVAGTTSGSRRSLGREPIELPALSRWIEAWAKSRNGQNEPARAARARSSPERTLPAALLFGSEKTGLSNEDLSRCQILVRIPTAPECPSMNLGQAVAVCCYELRHAGLVSDRPAGARIHRSEPASQESLERALERAEKVLDLAGYLQPRSRATALRKLRELLLGFGLTQFQVRILGAALAKVEWKLEHSGD